MGYGDAVAREVAWLTADLSAFSIGPLLDDQGGPFAVIKGFGRSAKARVQGRTLFVSRERVTEVRFDIQHKQHVHQLRLKIGWPIRSTTQETDLAALDNALELLLTRVRGPFGDKTHGGRFLQVAEGDEGTSPLIQVEYDEPELVDDNTRSEVIVRYLAADLPFTA